MPTERIIRMKQRLLSTRPSISAERMLLATRAYQKYAGEETQIFRAKVFAYVLDHMSVVIGGGELIVGNQNKRFRCASIFPEYTGQWLREQIDTLPTRPNDPLEVPAEERAAILKCLDWWKGRSPGCAVHGHVCAGRQPAAHHTDHLAADCGDPP